MFRPDRADPALMGRTLADVLRSVTGGRADRHAAGSQHEQAGPSGQDVGQDGLKRQRGGGGGARGSGRRGGRGGAGRGGAHANGPSVTFQLSGSTPQATEPSGGAGWDGGTQAHGQPAQGQPAASPAPVRGGLQQVLASLQAPSTSTWHPPHTSNGTSASAQPPDVVDLSADPDGAGAGSGRIQMSCPTNPRASVARLSQRNKNKHRRLFDGQSGALKDGEPVSYIMHGEKLLTGTVVIKEKGVSGILCDHCNAVISCSAFEAHAGHGQRRNPYDGITTSEGLTLRQIASKLQPLPEHYTLPESLNKRKSTGKRDASGATAALAAIADRCRDILGQLETLSSSCVICSQTDFEKDGFSDRTVIICDQCEREYHVGCLRHAGRCTLTAVPEGEWFCGDDCSGIRQTMSDLVVAGESACCGDPEYVWQVMRGRGGGGGGAGGGGGGGGEATNKALKLAQEVLQESFDPIIDVTTGQDLLPKMIQAQTLGEFDFQGMYTILLKHRGKAVCAALLRIFGRHLAEVPLVATRTAARRQGHCRVLMTAIERMLQTLNVGVLSLPAAQTAISTWVNAFEFRPMQALELQAVQSELRVLTFPGSQMLYRSLGPQPSDGPFAFALYPGEAPRASQPQLPMDGRGHGLGQDDMEVDEGTGLEQRPEGIQVRGPAIVGVCGAG